MKDGGFSAAHASAHLNLPPATINTLMSNNTGNADGLLSDIIDSWQRQPEPSWEELARALDKCDYKRITRKCEFKYIIIASLCGFNEVIYNMQWTHL